LPRTIDRDRLFSPHHREADVDRHTAVFAEAVDALVG
jgi:hypothetical protein